MVHLEESASMLFLGSPMVDQLDQLMGNGIYLSDIPIHDATRDVVLLGEQTRAQVCTPDFIVEVHGNIIPTCMQNYHGV